MSCEGLGFRGSGLEVRVEAVDQIRDPQALKAKNPDVSISYSESP